MDPDQGAQLAKAQEILHGFHPFVDIKGNIYGPLVFYMSALGQWISNYRLIGEVAIILIGYLLSYLLLFYLFEKASKNFIISFILLIISLSFLPRFYKYYIVLGPTLVLTFLYYYIFKKTNVKGVVLLAIFVGVTFLFRFDFGVYSFIIGIIAICFIPKVQEQKILKKKIIYFFASVFLVVFPFLLFLIINNRFPKALFESFSIIVGIARDLSLPEPVFNLNQSLFSTYNNFSLLFWFFRAIPFLILIILYIFRKKIDYKERLFILLTSVFSILIFIQALHRTSISHLFQVIPIQFVLIAWLIGLFKQKVVKCNSKTSIIIYFVVFFLMLGWGTFISNEHMFKNLIKNIKVNPQNYSYFFYKRDDLREKFKNNKNIKIVDFVNKNTKKNEPVFFMPLSPQFYYFSERLFKISLGVLGPGRLTTKEKQESFFRELIKTNTNIIVDNPFFCYDRMPERNPRYYYPVLMKLIYSHYRIVKKIGTTLILCRDNRYE